MEGDLTKISTYENLLKHREHHSSTVMKGNMGEKMFNGLTNLNTTVFRPTVAIYQATLF